MQFKLLFVVGSLLMMAGCRKQQKPRVDAKVSAKQVSTVYHELLALHAELPDAPFGFVVDNIVQDRSNQDMIEITYVPERKQVPNIQDICQSYRAEMELLGWNITGQFESDMGNHLLFVRPKNKVMCHMKFVPHYIQITLISKKE